MRKSITTARRNRERLEAQAKELRHKGTLELAAALAAARKPANPKDRPPTGDEMAEAAGLESREAVHRLIRWYEAGAVGSPWKRSQ